MPSMFSYTTAIQLATDAFRSVAMQQEFHMSLCRTVLSMVKQGRLVLNPQSAPYFAVKTDEEASICAPASPLLQLPPTLHYIPEHKKSRLRATYARAKQIYRPKAAHLSPEQHAESGPVKLSGSDAATNVALWPSAMQVNLGHDYKGGECSTALSPRQVADCINSKPDVTVRGAIAMLNALIQGVDEAWLDTPGVTKRSKFVVEPTMERCHAQEGQRVPASTTLSPRMAHSYAQSGSTARDTMTSVAHHTAPRMARSYGQIGFQVPAPSIETQAAHYAKPSMTRSYAQIGFPSRACVDQGVARFGYPSEDSPQPIQSYKEIYRVTPHNKERLRATFKGVQTIYSPGSCVHPSGQHPGSKSKLALHGTDGALNVALYPRAMLVRLNTAEEAKIANMKSTVQDPTGTVEGAIERLEAIVGGIGYKWIGVDRLDETQRTSRPARPLESPNWSMFSEASVNSESPAMSERTALSSSTSLVATPVEQVFPFNLEGKDQKL